MVAAMSSLRQIVEADNLEPFQKKSKLIGLGSGREVIYKLRLPPTKFVLNTIRLSKGMLQTCFCLLD
jgi:hypothetical protein